MPCLAPSWSLLQFFQLFSLPPFILVSCQVITLWDAMRCDFPRGYYPDVWWRDKRPEESHFVRVMIAWLATDDRAMNLIWQESGLQEQLLRLQRLYNYCILPARGTCQFGTVVQARESPERLPPEFRLPQKVTCEVIFRACKTSPLCREGKASCETMPRLEKLTGHVFGPWTVDEHLKAPIRGNESLSNCDPLASSTRAMSNFWSLLCQ